MTFYQRFEALCAQKCVSPTKAARDNGISQSTVAMWKIRGSTPNAKTVANLAKYFGVSQYYLTTGESTVNMVTFMPDADDPDYSDAAYANQMSFLSKIKDEATALDMLQYMERAFFSLNIYGQQEAIKRVMELTEIPRYRLQDGPEGAETDSKKEGD